MPYVASTAFYEETLADTRENSSLECELLNLFSHENCMGLAAAVTKRCPLPKNGHIIPGGRRSAGVGEGTATYLLLHKPRLQIKLFPFPSRNLDPDGGS